jgi:hypothetical protein
MALPDLPKPDYARKMKIVGYSDQGSRPDGCQIMLEKGFAYVAHTFSTGFSVIDVRNPRSPQVVEYVPSPKNSWNVHHQSHDDLLLLAQQKNLWAQPEFADEKAYYRAKTTDISKHAGATTAERDWSAGLVVYDISKPDKPKQIGFMPIDGSGLHRLWYVGGRWAYASALIEGFSDFIIICIDMADPAHPVVAGRYWLPGMNLAAGEHTNWPSDTGRFGAHHAIVDGDTAYCSWRDAGLVILDVKDRSKPKLIRHMLWSNLFAGATHTCVPLPDRNLLVVMDEATLDKMEDGYKPTWIFDISDKAKPKLLSAFPAPSDKNYVDVGGHFGPHNAHENRPGQFVSSELIFTTYQNAGVRIYDIRNQYAPVEVGALVPPPPARLVDSRSNRPKVLHSVDVLVDKNGLIYSTDLNAGLYIMEYDGFK